jgi:hypothetical protein
MRRGVFFLVALAGCATFSQLDSGLKFLVGKDKEVAFQMLGLPNAEQRIGGKLVFIWARSQHDTLFLPNSSTTYGNIGTVPFSSTHKKICRHIIFIQAASSK